MIQDGPKWLTLVMIAKLIILCSRNCLCDCIFFFWGGGGGGKGVEDGVPYLLQLKQLKVYRHAVH